MLDSKGNPHLIRKREVLETINSQEVMPEHLKQFKL
jgi:diaminopimelate decarboxylase